MSKTTKKDRVPISEEARENQMISLAMDLAEQQLRDGTASAQVIAHFLKLGSSKEKMEKKNLAIRNELDKAKIENLQSSQRIEELYSEAIQAMKRYGGQISQDDDN